MSGLDQAAPTGNVLLSLIVWTPMIGAFLVLLLPREQVDGARRAAFAFSLLTFLLSLALWAGFFAERADFQYLEQKPWIPDWGITYLIGVDGVSLFLVLLTTFLTPLVILFSFGDVQKRVKEYFFFMLMLETGMLGAFVALDLFLFYVFWELMLVPMYFIIGIWGGDRRVYASIKFLLYTLTASLLMLLAILYLVGAHVRAGGAQAPKRPRRRDAFRPSRRARTRRRSVPPTAPAAPLRGGARWVPRAAGARAARSRG